jgi:hypothetical protein
LRGSRFEVNPGNRPPSQKQNKTKKTPQTQKNTNPRAKWTEEWLKWWNVSFASIKP